MDRETFLDRLKAVGTNQARMCRDLDITATTPMRWKEAPGYAVAYLVALEIMTEAGRMTWRHKLALERLPKDVGEDRF